MTRRIAAGIALAVAATTVAGCGVSARLNDVERQSAIAFASRSVARMFSYSPSTLGVDARQVRSVTTTGFGTDFVAVLEGNAARRIRAIAAVSTATAERGGLLEGDPERPVILVYLKQTTMSALVKRPATVQSAVAVDLQRQADGSWLVSGIERITPTSQGASG